MKTFIILKNAVTAFFAAFLSVMSVQAVNVVNVPTAGQLSNALTQTQRDTITALKLTGFLDSNANGDYAVLRSMPNLQYLDISAVAITNNTIPGGAFTGKAGLKTVMLPTKVTTIGGNAFQNCSSLSDFTFPDSLQTIVGDWAFSGCNSLVTLKFPKSLKTIGNNSFRDCTGLTSIQFSEGLQSIGDASFYNCPQLAGQLTLPSTLVRIYCSAFDLSYQLKSCKILAATPPTLDCSNSLGTIATVYVPATAASNYQSAKYWKDKIIIAGDQLTTLTLNITTPGTLGARALEQFSYLNQINVLNLSGTLNSDDFSKIRDMISLVSVDISGLTNTELYDNLFNGRTGLQTVKLPAKLKKINYGSFYNCYALSAPVFPDSLSDIGISAFQYCVNILALDFPDSLKYIGDYAFESCYNMKTVNFPNGLLTIGYQTFGYCSSLSKAIIPQSVTSIGANCFGSCTALSQVSLPDNLTIINSSTFYGCTSLAGIQLPSKLTTLGDNVFYNCTALTSITLPAGLTDMRRGGRIFSNCTALKQVVCLQSTPPVIDGYDQFTNINKANCELLVPFWALTDYKLADSWKLFPVINGYNQEIPNIVVNGSLTLSDGVRPLGLPNMEITPNGNLTVVGNTPFNTNNFVLKPQFRNIISTNSLFSQFISNCSSMTAQQVKIDMSAYGNRWYYLTLPFDAAISNITVDDGAYFVFRRYDGQTRAAQGTGNSWKTMATSDILRAGTGYIFQCNKDITHLVITATADSKNKLFQSTAKTFPLNAYASDNTANSNWNLMGNPSPSYFDISFLDFTAPITYWNDATSRYEALSPADDAFLLRPYQAFFVQKPADLASISFLPEGRQTTTEIVNRAPALRSSSDRVLINLEVNNEEYGDKTRVVINPKARLDYELNCDASKFMSTEPQVPQLYSLDESATQYAINERPLDDGIVSLGFYAGTADRYVISLKNTGNDYSVVLWDKLLNVSTDLDATDYSFNSEAGTFNNRFELHIAKSGNGVTHLNPVDQLTAKVFTSSRNIMVETNTPGKTVTVFTAGGIKIAETFTVAGSVSIPATQGIYIVKIDNATFKVVVY